jgi:hypothetical protein
VWRKIAGSDLNSCWSNIALPACVKEMISLAHLSEPKSSNFLSNYRTWNSVAFAEFMALLAHFNESGLGIRSRRLVRTFSKT